MEIKVERVGREFGTKPKREPSAYDFENMPVGIGGEDGVVFRTGGFGKPLYVARIDKERWAYLIGDGFNDNDWNIVRTAPYAFMENGNMYISFEHSGIGTFTSREVKGVEKGIFFSAWFLQERVKKTL